MNKNLYQQFMDLEKEYKTLSSEYENNRSFEMAFISIWSIAEHIMKPIASISMKNKLQNSLNEWVKYIENPETKNKPKEFKSFQFEYSSTSIPSIAQIESAVGPMPKLTTLMDSKGKYRKKRNGIAHRAEKISETVYGDYKKAVLEALSELRNVLEKRS